MDNELQEITATEFFKLVNNELIEKAYLHISKENLNLKSSTKFSVLIKDEPFPPKDFLRIVAKLQGYVIVEKGFNGGKANTPFEKLNYEIIGNREYPFYNESLLYPQIKKYQNAIDNTDWLVIDECYKFHFLKWIEENIDFENDTNQVIQDKISESQQIIYGPESKEKGVNFIQSIKRHQDDYLTIDDIQKLKNVILHSAPANKKNLTLSFNSFPKSSAFLCLFAPSEFMAYDGESIPAYEFLSKGSGDIKTPKRNYKAFRFYQIFYKNIKKQLKSSHLNISVFKKMLAVETLTELHWNFITQDFLLYVTRKIMIDTLQKKYNEFINNEVPEDWLWYKNLSRFSEIMKILKTRCAENKYSSYQELNDDFKALCENSAEDFLQRYLFESNNGFSTIRNQLIKINRRTEISNTIRNDFKSLKEILLEDNIEKSLSLIHNLIGGNNWTVIYRFLRALFPNNFTSVDSPNHFKVLSNKLNNEYEIILDGKNQIENNQQVLELLDYKDIYKAQIFFWIYKEGIDKEIENSNDDNDNKLENMNQPLNQILYGPPGTGKTYKTKKLAVEIIEGLKYSDSKEDRAIILGKYEDYVASENIHFTTFHQNMSYEDFIEGIKPMIEDDEERDLGYVIQDGIFKNICNKALKKISKSSNQRSQQIDNQPFEIAWTHLIEDFSDILENSDKPRLPTSTGMAMHVVGITNIGNLLMKPSKGGNLDYIISYNRAKKLFNAFSDLSVIRNIDKEFRQVIGGSNSTAYWCVLNYLHNWIDDNQDQINQKDTDYVDKPTKFILIIDEINRGNVSAIFGELITLIETDKREGEIEAISVTLPYSKSNFSVPSNVYIIGTMNTADRSVEALDTALRRRFTFKEFPPKSELIKTEGLSGTVNGVISINNRNIDLDKLLNKINERIEKLIDKDHKIGHSYFMRVNSEGSLKKCFKNNIIPLLEEYFFGDYGKIGLVLGNSFVEKLPNKDSLFSNFDGYESDIVSDLMDRPVFKIKQQKDWDFSTI